MKLPPGRVDLAVLPVFLPERTQRLPRLLKSRLSQHALLLYKSRHPKMSSNLSEEEMRLALFGPSTPSETPPLPVEPEAVIAPPPPPPPKPRPAGKKPLSPKLRVTLHVTKEFEGDVEVFVHDANTLSTFVAEQEAKAEAKKKKFKYFDVVSIKPI